MKKAFLLGVALLATFSLTGCDMIQKLIQGGQDVVDEKKEYNYDDFAVLIAGTKFSFDYTKCTEVIELNDEKTTHEYTYDSENNIWYYVTGSEDDPITHTVNVEIANFVKQCKDVSAILKKNVDNIFKFSASKKGYFITAHYKTDSTQLDGEYDFNTDGLKTLFDETQTDLDSVKATKRKVTYTYSK